MPGGGVSLSITHDNIAGILEAQGKLAEALAEYEAEKRTMQELTARDPDNAQWRRDLSVAHNCVGSILQAQGRLAEALAECEDCKRIMQELTARDPDNARVAAGAGGCAQQCRRHSGGAGQAGGGAGRVRGRQADHAGATARDPDNAQWRRDLSIAHNNVGGILQAQGRVAEALAEYEEARKLAP